MKSAVLAFNTSATALKAYKEEQRSGHFEHSDFVDQWLRREPMTFAQYILSLSFYFFVV